MQLPPELLLLIFGCLGTGFFREDLGRLTVSKQWWHLAWTVLVRHLQFDNLSSLEKFTKHEAVVAQSQPYINTVSLSIGFRQPLHVNKTHVTKSRSRRRAKKLTILPEAELFGVASSKSTARKATVSTNAVGEDGIKNEPSQLNSSLTTLAATLQGCHAMRSLKVEIQLPRAARPLVLGKPLVDLLSVPHLTSLHYDTGGCLLAPTEYSGTHRCRSISAMLPSLRRLRCRMERMCEDLLAPPPGEAPLALEEVIVYLTAPQCVHDVKSCRFPDVFYLRHIRELMEKQARALVARLANPRMVRVITHEALPGVRGPLMPYALDVIEGKRTKLRFNAEWDAEGVVVDEDDLPHWRRRFTKD